MTDPDIDSKSNGDENEKSAIDTSVSVPIDDIDESKAQLINANGGAGDHSTEVAIVDGTDKSSDQISFNGLGKEEVMQYANDPFWIRLRWVLFILFWVGWFAMLVTAIVIIVVAPRCPHRPDLKWYQKDTIYQAYAKSFKDSDKDGFGDFQGLKDKFEYITDDVGANAVYVNGIYKTDPDAGIPSDEADLAIIDHKALDDKFEKTFGNFKSWIKDLRKKGQQVVLDFIPNHTSKKHEWFEKSKKSEKGYKDYYIWAGTAGTPPNDFKDINGESAWEFDNDRNQWYYHYHSAALPELNLNNEAVREEIKDIMKFWFGAGIGGFNIQDLDFLVESEDMSSDNATQSDFDGTLDFLEELRSVANSYSDKPGRERFLFGNVMGDDVNKTKQYWGDDDKKNRLHLVLPSMDIADGAESISSWIGDLPDGGKQWLGLQLGNQDTSRIASKKSSDNFLKIAHALQMLLPGTPFNYYGDEFGQKDGNKSPLANNRFNPLNARTPMQWNDEKNAGFTEPDVTPWMQVGSEYKSNNLRVSRARYNDHSSFRLLKELVDLRQRESFQWGKTKACAANKDVLLFTRKADRFPYFLTLINMGTEDQHPHLPSLDCVDSKEKGKVVFHSREDSDLAAEFDNAVRLEPGDIIVIEFAADKE